MNSTVTETLTGRERATRVCKYFVRRVLFPVGVLCPFAYFFPKIAILYLACGAYDVGRNKGLNLSTLRRYFIGNGFGTWLLSPFNTLLDLLSLPYINRGVYRLEDFPSHYQEEVKRLIELANDQNLVGQLQERVKEFPRTMVFFRWYGINLDSLVNIPAFHEPWKYIQTIGVSVFNKKVSTSKHFGPLRASLRILYNLNDTMVRSAYIKVGDTVNYWNENKLFIFDDTLLHESVNKTDETRYCLFVDIIRPTPFPAFMRGVVFGVRFLTQSIKFIYYNNWKILER